MKGWEGGSVGEALAEQARTWTGSLPGVLGPLALLAS